MNICKNDEAFYIHSPSSITKIEVIDYDKIHKLVKINLKDM